MRVLLIFSFILPCSVFGQGSFASPAGQVGTTAIHKDSSIFVAWATNCVTYRGPQDIATTSSPLVSLGDDYNATGQSGEFGVVSLGDGGEAILTFDTPIINGTGWDFAVFENGFNDTFLELAFVEVSSDGVNYYRFPATSETQDTLQTDGFGNTDATKVNNLAGKYKAQYGTPFDLDEMTGVAGLDVNNVTHVKIIDVVGTIDETYATFDQFGQKINDPYPTDFASGGFDLDAVGVIHQEPLSVYHSIYSIDVYPNPAEDIINLVSNGQNNYSILSLSGKIMTQGTFTDQTKLSLSDFAAGIYLLKINDQVQRLIIH